jgi:hypothetical protein
MGLPIGVEGGFAGSRKESSLFGIPFTLEGWSGEGKWGLWDEDKPGGGSDTRFGIRLGGGVHKSSFNKDGAISGDFGVDTANLEASAGTNGATLGFGANIEEESMTVGNFDKNRDIDESVHMGASEGIGMGGRLHWGDSDNDGHREVGFGFDLGPVTMDWKTEDPLRTALYSGNTVALNRLLGLLNDETGFNDTMGKQLLPSNEGNMTEDLLGWVSGSGKSTTIDETVSNSWKKLSSLW